MKAKAYFEALGRSDCSRGIKAASTRQHQRENWQCRWMHEAYNRGFVNQLWRRGERSTDFRPRRSRQPQEVPGE
jgi:hypothetical protein